MAEPGTPAYRYLHEERFATLVDSLIALLAEEVVTADDVRQALRLAVKELARPRGRKGPVRHPDTAEEAVDPIGWYPAFVAWSQQPPWKITGE